MRSVAAAGAFVLTTADTPPRLVVAAATAARDTLPRA
jgi:hypothetical protein